MLGYAILFLVLAILAAIFGFGMAATAFAVVAKLLFALFLIAFIAMLVMSRRRV